MKMRKNRGLALAAAFFALCALMTAFYLIAGYGAYLDSDMASELALAEQLVAEKSLFSSEWYYSTEVRLLNTQLIFTPLMALFGGNWQLVRTAGCIALLAILAVSCLYASVAMGAKKEYALVFAGLTISVCSPIYAQNVIIGAYYIPHAVLAFLLVGLYSGWMNKRTKMPVVLLLMLSFVMGMSTIRYLLSAILPLAGAALWQFVFPKEGEDAERDRRQIQTLALGVGIAVSGAAGYVIGQKLLPLLFRCRFDYYGGTGYASFTQHDLGMQIQTVIYGLLSSMGFQDAVPLFGAQGILNALMLLEIVVAGMLVMRLLRREKEDVSRVGALTLVFAFVLSGASFVLLRSVYFDRYWLPIIMLGAPVMALCLSREKNRVFSALALALFAGTVLLSSASCMYYSMRNPQAKTDMRMAAVDAARERGLNKGYATFWNANILTELSDGEMDIASVEFVYEDGNVSALRPNLWLETDEAFAMNTPDEAVFLLVGQWESAGVEPLLERVQAQRVDIPGWIDFYIIPSQRLLFEVMAL